MKNKLLQFDKAVPVSFRPKLPVFLLPAMSVGRLLFSVVLDFSFICVHLRFSAF